MHSKLIIFQAKELYGQSKLLSTQIEEMQSILEYWATQAQWGFAEMGGYWDGDAPRKKQF